MLPWLALAILVAIAFHGALSTPFVFDDLPAVIENPSLRALWPPSVPLSPPAYFPTAGRPLVNLSFALNYRAGGLDPFGYHLASLALHALSAGLLYAIVRRTLARLGTPRPAPLAAFLAAWIWGVHPLQSEAVVYVTQRTELAMGALFLATLLASIRAWDAGTPGARHAWTAAAALACSAGMACKETMVAAPIVVLLYDRAFVSGSVREAWRRSPALYRGLFVGWLVLLALNAGAPRADTAGFHHGVSPLAWWATQTEVLWIYARLALWPQPLALHYALPLADGVAAVWPWLLATAALVAATALALWRNRASGFLAASALLVLAPSSLVPIVTEVAAERRMYLPLAAIVAGAVVGAFRRAQRSAAPTRARALVAAALALVAVFAGVGSARRVLDYRSPLSIWQDTVAKQPASGVARKNLGLALGEAGRLEDGVEQLEEAVRLDPGDADARYDLGNLLAAQGRLDAAIAAYTEALHLRPAFGQAQNNLGIALVRANRLPEAIAAFESAVAARPDDASARANLEQARARRPDEDRGPR